MQTRRPDDLLRDALAAVAPNAELDEAGPDDDLAFCLGLDSLDVLNVVAYLYDHAGVDIPERDLPLIRTRRGFAEYVAASSDGPPGAPAR